MRVFAGFLGLYLLPGSVFLLGLVALIRGEYEGLFSKRCLRGLLARGCGFVLLLALPVAIFHSHVAGILGAPSNDVWIPSTITNGFTAMLVLPASLVALILGTAPAVELAAGARNKGDGIDSAAKEARH
jgi:hypothetical protein